jgi:hypothetical protein
MKNLPLFIFMGFVLLVFNSCDPASAIYVSNKTKHDIYIEYTLEDSVGSKIDSVYLDVYNNINLTSGASESLLFIFPGTSIIRFLGFGDVKTTDDIISAIDLIFASIDVFKVIQNGDTQSMERLYGKTYFLDKNNIKLHKYPVSYSVELIIK